MSSTVSILLQSLFLSFKTTRHIVCILYTWFHCTTRSVYFRHYGKKTFPMSIGTIHLWKHQKYVCIFAFVAEQPYSYFETLLVYTTNRTVVNTSMLQGQLWLLSWNCFNDQIKKLFFLLFMKRIANVDILWILPWHLDKEMKEKWWTISR